MHLPYTSMVLSYVLIGAALSPSIYLDRVILGLLAYFFGLGLSAHALNELHARHWGEALSRAELRILFALPLAGAFLVGAYGMYVLRAATHGGLLAPLILLALILLETFFLYAYNTDFSNGRFHNDVSFAFSWAALPFLTSYYVNSLTITVSSILVAAGLSATAMIEISLSRWCKDFRRGSPVSEIRFADGNKLGISTNELIARPEKSLKLIVLAVDLIAVGLIMARVFG